MAKKQLNKTKLKESLKKHIKNILKETINKKPSLFKEKVSELYDLEEGPGCPEHCGKCGSDCENMGGYCDPCVQGALSKKNCGVCRPTLGSSPHDKTKGRQPSQLQQRESIGELINEQGSNSYPVNGAAAYVRSCAIGGYSFNTNFLVDGAVPQGGQIFQHGGYAGNDKVFVSSNDGAAYNQQNHVYGNGGLIDNPNHPCPSFNGQCNGNWPHWPIQSKTSLTPPPGVSMQQFCPNICTNNGTSQGYGPNSAACQTTPTGGCDPSAWPNHSNWINTWTNLPNFSSSNPNQPCNMICNKLQIWNNNLSGAGPVQTNQLNCKIEEAQNQSQIHGCNC